MEDKIVFLLLLAIIASGCAEQQASGNGITIERFSISDTTLNPNQQARIEVEIANYNEAPTTLDSENINLFNTGQLKVKEDSKNCSPTSIGSAKKDINPRIVCSWTVEAPDQSFVEGFKSKPLSVKLRLKYESTLENNEGIKIEFNEMSEIDETNDISRSMSNGDIKAEITSQSPIALENPQTINIKISETGPGSIDQKYGYKFNFSSEIVTGCDNEVKPIQGKAQVSCTLKADNPGTHTLFTSTSYKYEKSPNLDIEVVNK